MGELTLADEGRLVPTKPHKIDRDNDIVHMQVITNMNSDIVVAILVVRSQVLTVVDVYALHTSIETPTCEGMDPREECHRHKDDISSKVGQFLSIDVSSAVN
jgi:hypothetical protein